jgi:hypothetical protein
MVVRGCLCCLSAHPRLNVVLPVDFASPAIGQVYLVDRHSPLQRELCD